MTVALVPASFDPITRGHVDIITRATRLFDRVVVAAFARPRKNVLFPIEERLELIRESLDGLKGIEVMSYEGLTVTLAREVGANVIVRGLRAVSDFESEFQQSALNRMMLPGVEVISMFAGVEYWFLSSSIIKEIAENGGDVSSMVPAPVARRLQERFGRPTEPAER